MKEPIQSFPLSWPAGWARRPTYQRNRAKFSRFDQKLSVMDGSTRVLGELERMGIARDDVVVSTNVPTRLDGLPRSDQREPLDPGAAVYWRAKNVTRCMAIDRYDRVADNLAAIAATLEALRAVERHGGGAILDRAFEGFKALPAAEQAWQVLGLASSRPNRAEIEEAYRRLAMKHHPDRGGRSEDMARINAARDELIRGIS